MAKVPGTRLSLPPRTRTKVIFQGCQIAGEKTEYGAVIRIVDGFFNTMYEFPMPEEIRVELVKSLTGGVHLPGNGSFGIPAE